MKILLLNPINRSYVIMPSLGLGYLAAVLSRDGHEVRILNCMKEGMTFDDFGAYIQGETFDLIGFQVFSYDLNSVKEHLAIIRRSSAGSVVVAGGPHPSGDPAGTMAFLPELDYAFQGEAEIGLPLLVAGLVRGEVDHGSIPGLIWRSGESVQSNPPAAVRDLDSLPMPAWDLLAPETYPEAPHGAFARQFPVAPIIVSRGCPSRCTFCAGATINGRTVRRRSIDNVLQELRALHDRGIREFHIEDENFTLVGSYVLEFCRRLQAEQLHMSWSLPSGVRLDTLNREMLLAMAEAGCYSLAVGIEFGTDRILQLTLKGSSVAMIRQKLELFRGTGIKVTGFFMFGIPGETPAEMGETARFSRSLPLDRAQFNIFMPLPGSREWDKLKAAGKLSDVAWDRFFVHDVAYTDGSVSAAQYKRIQRVAVLRFYLRPRILWGLAREIRSFRHLKFLVKRLADTLM